ncbi:MAG: radical SAM protein, partial [Caldilineae bacterium]
SVSYPLPGTKFYARVRDQLGDRQNWQDSQDLAMLYHGPFPTAFYRQLHTVLHKEYRARKYARELVHTLRSPARMQRGHLRRAAAALYHTLTLPLARRKLDRLARLPHEAPAPLHPALSPTAAATPTPQHDGG